MDWLHSPLDEASLPADEASPPTDEVNPIGPCIFFLLSSQMFSFYLQREFYHHNQRLKTLFLRTYVDLLNYPFKGTVLQFIFLLKSGHHGAIDFVLCPAKFWINADFALQNCGDIVLGDKKYHQILLSSLFCV